MLFTLTLGYVLDVSVFKCQCGSVSDRRVSVQVSVWKRKCSSVSVEMSVFKCKSLWKCQCVSVSVAVSVFNGFSGRTQRNAFGKKERAQVASGDTQQPLPISSRALSAQFATRLCIRKSFPENRSNYVLLVLPPNDVRLKRLGVTPGIM